MPTMKPDKQSEHLLLSLETEGGSEWSKGESRHRERRLRLRGVKIKPDFRCQLSGEGESLSG